MKAVAVGVAAAALGAAIVVVGMVGPDTARINHTGQRICGAMLGGPPADDMTVAGLEDTQAQSLAPAGLAGQDAYRFVATLNTVTNWRQLDGTQVSAWALNPSAVPLPTGAQIDVAWPAPQADPDTIEPAKGNRMSPYESACAAVLARADLSLKSAVHSSAVTSSPTRDSLSASPTAAPPSVSMVESHLGTSVSPDALWQWTSPTPTLDAKRTLFELLTRTAPTVTPHAGNLVCYDFTVSGPAHCALVLTTGAAPSMAVITGEGLLAAAPIPAHSTMIEPVPAEATR